jgi:hypothetical protein
MKNDTKNIVVSFLPVYTLKIYSMCIVKLYKNLIAHIIFCHKLQRFPPFEKGISEILETSGISIL